MGDRRRLDLSKLHTEQRINIRKHLLIILLFSFVCVSIVLLTPKEPFSSSSATDRGNTDNSDSNYSGLVISEVMPSNRSAVADDNGSYSDWVEIWNSSDCNISLKNVGLSDRDDTIRFLFPDVILLAGERVLVFCSGTNQNTPGKTFHAKFKLSSVGETVYLYDSNAYLIDSVTYPIMGTNESWGLVDGEYRSVAYFSPGFENTEAGNEAYCKSIMSQDSAIVINEVMPEAYTGLRDEDDELCDWIELYNTTDKAITIDGYGLSDNENKPMKWRLPDGTVIQPYGYYIVFCSGKDRTITENGVPHTNFRISAKNETLILSDRDGHLLDRVMMDNIPEDCSYGRNSSGSMEVFEVATPGLPNDQDGFRQMDINLRMINPTGVYINEILTSNDSVSIFQDDVYADYIELYNSSSESVDLSNYGLSDSLTHARKWQFPVGTMIAAGEYKVIICDGQTSLTTPSEIHTSFRLSRTDKEIICFADPHGRILDKVNLPEQRTDVSYGRTTGISGFYYYDAPTPFTGNENGFAGYTPNPSFTVEPGVYYSTVNLELNIPAGTQVFYTTDGSTPTEKSTPYNGERLELNFNTVLRARAFSADGLHPSDIITGTYLINIYHTLPVVSVITDPLYLWDYDNGMLADGPIVKAKAAELPFKNSTYRKVKESGARFPCHVEIYETDGTTLLSQDCEFSLMGDFSLDMPQKSMKFRAKSAYGQKTFAAQLFPDRTYTEYKSFVLRNSGNDCMWTRLTDGFESRLLDKWEHYNGQTTIMHQAWRPVAVYLNGVYWGHMNLRERVDKYFVAQHEGLPLDEADNIDVLQASGAVKYGSNKEYKAMIKKIKAGDPANNPSDLQYILDNVDVDNLLEYMALEMFVGNSDIGNTRFYRIKSADSKWRWIWYDADYGLFDSAWDSPKSYTRIGGMGDQRIDNTIFIKVLSVPEYRDLFLRKLGKIFQFFTTENMLDTLDPLVELITPEMELHWARWGTENDPMVISEVPTTVDGAYRYWEKRVNRLRNVVKKRPTKLWELVQKTFKLTNAEMEEYFGPMPVMPDDVI